jgi:lactoylglutathione lyase
MAQAADDDFVMIELVSGPSRVGAAASGSGLSHFVINVESLEATMADLAAVGSTWRRPTRPTGQRTS